MQSSCLACSSQSGCLWRPWRWAASCSCCWSECVGVSAALTPAAATSAAGAAPTLAAAPDTVSAHRSRAPQHVTMYFMSACLFVCLLSFFGKVELDLFPCPSVRGWQAHEDGLPHPAVTHLPSVLCFWCANHGPHRPPFPGGQDLLSSSFRRQPPHRWYVRRHRQQINQCSIVEILLQRVL